MRGWTGARLRSITIYLYGVIVGLMLGRSIPDDQLFWWIGGGVVAALLVLGFSYTVDRSHANAALDRSPQAHPKRIGKR